MGNRALEILPVFSWEEFASTIGLNPCIRNPRGGHSPGYRTPVAYCDTPCSYRRSWGHHFSPPRYDRHNWLRYARGFEDGADYWHTGSYHNGHPDRRLGPRTSTRTSIHSARDCSMAWMAPRKGFC